MKKKQVKKKAAQMGIKTRKMNKTELIHAIQLEEKNPPCFRADIDACDQTDCCWRSDCLPTSNN